MYKFLKIIISLMSAVFMFMIVTLVGLWAAIILYLGNGHGGILGTNTTAAVAIIIISIAIGVIISIAVFIILYKKLAKQFLKR